MPFAGLGCPFRYVLASDLTSSRIRAALLSFLDTTYTLPDVSVRLTRAGGTMALLLCAGIESDRIRVGRWRSDEMYRYLHVQAQPAVLMNGLAAAMFHGGSFRLMPS